MFDFFYMRTAVRATVYAAAMTKQPAWLRVHLSYEKSTLFRVMRSSSGSYCGFTLSSTAS